MYCFLILNLKKKKPSEYLQPASNLEKTSFDNSVKNDYDNAVDNNKRLETIFIFGLLHINISASVHDCI